MREKRRVTPEMLSAMVELLPTIGSLRDLCAVTGLGLETVRRETAPFLAIMKLQGTHPKCGCGRDRFHPYGCADSYVKGTEGKANYVPGRKISEWDEVVDLRAQVVDLLVAGHRFVEIEAALGLPRGSARPRLRFLTPEQRAERERNCQQQKEAA